MFDIGSLFSKFIPQDALSEAGLSVIEAQVAPLFAAARAELLRRITGDPPATFALHLQEKGWPIDTPTSRALWGAVIAALADEPCATSTAS